MTRGVLLCAHDNNLYWYGRMAYCCALMIKGHMGEDTDISLITDETTWNRLVDEHSSAKTIMEPIVVERPMLNNVRTYRTDGRPIKSDYYNFTRRSVFDLSPYDETLVIDVDMLILDDRLNLVWNSDNELMMNCKLSPLTFSISDGLYVERLGGGLPLYWATVFYFRKTRDVEEFFHLVNYIAENYDYYALLYGYPGGLYRNDHTFSVATHIKNGHSEDYYGFVKPLPSPLKFAWNKDQLVQLNRGSAIINIDSKTPPIVEVKSNIHCMNKSNLEAFSDRIIELYA